MHTIYSISLTVLICLNTCIDYSVGSMFSLFPHPLYYEVAEFSTSSTLMSNVSAGMEVQGVESQM